MDDRQCLLHRHILVEAEFPHGRIEVVIPERLRPVVEVQRDEVAHDGVAVEHLAIGERANFLQGNVDALGAHVVDDLRDFPLLDAADLGVELAEARMVRIKAEADDVELAPHEVGRELHAVQKIQALLPGRGSGLPVARDVIVIRQRKG